MHYDLTRIIYDFCTTHQPNLRAWYFETILTWYLWSTSTETNWDLEDLVAIMKVHAKFQLCSDGCLTNRRSFRPMNNLQISPTCIWFKVLYLTTCLETNHHHLCCVILDSKESFYSIFPPNPVLLSDDHTEIPRIL